MANYDYTTLVQTIKDQIEDDSTEFDTYLTGSAMLIAHDRLFKDLDLFLEREFQDVTTVAGSPLISTPTDFEFSDNIVFFDSNEMIDVRKKTLDYVKDYWPNKTLTDKPKYYAIYGSSQIYLAPTPNAVYTTEISYNKRPEVLTATTTTNYYTDNAWEALVAALTVEMLKFIKDYGALGQAENGYERAIVKHNDVVRTKRLESGMILANPEIGTQER